MRLVGYNQNGLRLIGSVSDDMVTPLGGVEDYYRSAGTLKPSGAAPIPLAELELVLFVPVTSRVFCVGINYKVHAAEALEVGGIDEPPAPMVFGRWASTLVTDGTPVPVPPNEDGLDWEAELAAVIKDEVWGATEHDALQHVLGYTAFNDLSARRKQAETLPLVTAGRAANHPKA